MKVWYILTLLSLGLFCVTPKSGNVSILLVVLYLITGVFTSIYLKKRENQLDTIVKIIVISTIIEVLLVLFLVISFIILEIYLWNWQETSNAIIAVIPNSLWKSLGTLTGILGVVCLIVSFINLIHVYENKAGQMIEMN